MHRISTRDLQIIDAITRDGSVRAAARRLHIAQPPLSRALHQLEERVGVRLFERSSRGMQPTPEGEELAYHAADILARLGRAEDAVRDLGSGHAGHLRIGYTDDFQYGWFPRRFSDFLAAHPAVEVHLEQDYTPLLCERVASGLLDLAFITPPSPTHLVDLEIQSLGPTPLRLLVPADHPVAKRPRVGLEILRGEVLIVGALRPESGFYIQIMQTLRGFEREIRFRRGIYPTAMIANAVASGIGWALVPPDSMPDDRTDVVLVPFDDERIQIFRGIALRRGSQSPAVRRFLAELDVAASVPFSTRR